MTLWQAGACTALGIALGAAGMAAAQAVLPTPVHGIMGEKLGMVDLGKAFPVMTGYELRLSRLTVPSGGGLTPHSHKDIPEIVYIVSGRLTEQRNGGPLAVFGPGSVLINDETVTHAVLNQGSEPVVYYGAHVSKPQPPPPHDAGQGAPS
jgi:mannose-6-phosphate isomerase-like protein (cupin superfamily)